MNIVKTIMTVLGIYLLTSIVTGFVVTISTAVVEGVRVRSYKKMQKKKAKGQGLNSDLYDKIQAGDYIYAKGEVVS